MESKSHRWKKLNGQEHNVSICFCFWDSGSMTHSMYLLPGDFQQRPAEHQGLREEAAVRQSCLDPSSGSILDTILSLYPRLWLSSPILDNPLFTPCFIALTLNERRGGKKLWKVSVCCCCKSLGSSRRTVEGIDEWPLKDLVALLSVCRREIMCFGTIKDLTKVF